MKELQFVALRQEAWDRWDRWLGISPVDLLKASTEPKKKFGRPRRRRQIDAIQPDELPHLFRTLCHDLSLATDRCYSSPLIDRLQNRVLLAHQYLYGAKKRLGSAIFHFVLAGFPQLVRRERKVVIAATLLFLLPFLLIYFTVAHDPGAVYNVVPAPQVASFESMYAPNASHLGRPRGVVEDWQMYAFYINNNISIDFKCFAGGIAFGIGSVFFLIYNGLMLGAVASHITGVGYGEAFWGYVTGHSGFELIGMALSGAAGLKIGAALIAPGRRRRSDALRENAAIAVQILYGAAGMTFLAAFIEAFWSPRRGLPTELKYTVGAVLWLLLIAYFLFSGRRERDIEGVSN